MASSPLLFQIADRTATFLRNTGVSQSRLCRHLSISDSSLSQFLNGTKGLDPATVIKLCQTLSLSHREVVEKLTEQPVRSAKILNLQESVEGRPARMRLDGNEDWYPGTGGSGAGQDPNDGRTIDDVPDADTQSNWDQALIDTLREARGYHRKIVRAINNFINRAKANRDGVTPPTAQHFTRRS